MRNAAAPSVELESSGGINLKTLRDVASTGIDRISLGALTHSAINLDLGLDWRLGTPKTDLLRSTRWLCVRPQVKSTALADGPCDIF